MRSLRDQMVIDGMRTNKIIEEHKDRNITDRKGNYEFYTARMYDRIFFTDHPTPVSKKVSLVDDMKEPDSRIEKYTNDLKLLLFAPGTDIDLPFMGHKTAIFTKDQMSYYDYSLVLDTASYLAPVYAFTIMADLTRSSNNTVIREMKTIFDQESMQILGRSYQLAYKTLFYSFDVSMNIDITKHEGNYIPTLIEYKGQWDVPLRKPELCKFSFRIVDFY